MLKRLTIALYFLLLGVMGAATFVEKYNGSEFIHETVYGSWWFSGLWALGTALACLYFIRRKVRQVSVICLHLSFLIILLGAFVTHMFSDNGIIMLREGKPATTYIDNNGTEKPLPFSITLKKFNIVYHPGTTAPRDYISRITLSAGGKEQNTTISMNRIYRHATLRLSQKSYDEDLLGSTLLLSSDPIGIPLTYTGYALLFLSLIWMLFDPNGAYKKLLQSNVLQRTVCLMLFFLPFIGMQGQHTMSQESADKFGQLFVVYNDRVCPLETFARDFTKKLYGKPYYKDFSACQVLTGFMFWGKEWMDQPVIKMKHGELRKRFHLDSHVAPIKFFGPQGYILGPFIQMDTHDKFYQQVMDVDDKLMLIMGVQHMEPLTLFPYSLKEHGVKWFSPASALPDSMPSEQQKYIQDIIPLMGNYAVKGDYHTVNEIIAKMAKYQMRYGAASLPSTTQIWAERVYNKIPFATILFMANLTLALLSLLFIGRKKGSAIFAFLTAASFLALTFCLALRWIISGTIPMNNGYETMLFVSWLVLLVSLSTMRKLKVMITFGLLLSGFMLLVSHISQMDPAITHRMPVLNSPLLSIHVSIIMMAYALLSLDFILSLAYFFVCRFRVTEPLTRQLTWLSNLFLYPAIAFLGIGIFVGAIWANISWGVYWSWDPKEVWALVSFMVYAAPLHVRSLPALQKPLWHHLYMLLAFLIVLMTYFGVNYFLGGMHSYA